MMIAHAGKYTGSISPEQSVSVQHVEFHCASPGAESLYRGHPNTDGANVTQAMRCRIQEMRLDDGALFLCS
jgi:hypothetical protein